MAQPIDPLPERELCQYEKIRENIIKEREEAMAKYNFFENLNDTKKDIGFYKADKQPKKNEQGKMLTKTHGCEGNEQVGKDTPRGKSNWK